MADTPVDDAEALREQARQSIRTDIEGELKANAQAGAQQADDQAVQQDQQTQAGRGAAAAAGPLGALMPAPRSQEQLDRRAGRVRSNQSVDRGVEAAGIGAVEAGFNTKDAILPEALGGGPGFDAPNWSSRSAFRQSVEARGAELDRTSPGNYAARTITEWGVGFMGLGKIAPVLKGAGGIVGWGKDVARAAMTGAVAMDPHGERISNSLVQFPLLTNPVTTYLAQDGTAGEGRLKNAVESIIGDGIAAAGYVAAVKSYKFLRAGDIPAAQAAQQEASELFIKSSANQAKLAAQPRVPNPEEIGYVPPPSAIDTGIPEGGRTAPGAALSRQEQAALQDSQLGREPQAGATPNAEARTPNANPDGGVSGGGDGLPAPGSSPVGVLPDAGGGAGGEPNLATQSANEPALGVAGRETASPSVLPEGTTVRPAAGQPQAVLRAPVTPEVLSKQIEDVGRDAAAISKYGSYEDALQAGYKVKAPDFIPWEKLSTSEGARAWVDQTVKDAEPFITKVRGGNEEGVLTDARVNQMVAQRVNLLGEDPGVLMGMLQAAGKNANSLVANMQTGFLLSRKVFEENYALARRLSVGNFDGFASIEEAKQALLQRQQAALEVAGASLAMRAAGARATRLGGYEARLGAIQMQTLDGLDPDNLIKVILSTEGDAAKMRKLAEPTVRSRIHDFVGAYVAANNLWGWATHVANSVGNVAQLYMRPLSKAVGSFPQQLAGRVLDNAAMTSGAIAARAQAREEMLRTHTFLADAWQAAKWTFLNGESRIIPQGAESMSFGAKGGATPGLNEPLAFTYQHGIEDVASNTLTALGYTGQAMKAAEQALTLPLRVLGAADEAVKVLRYRAVVSAKAVGEADRLGLSDSADVAAFIKKRVDESFDPHTGVALDTEAAQEAKVATFQQDLPNSSQDVWYGSSSIGAKIQQGVGAVPITRFILPYVKTPVNLLRQGQRYTPGLNLLQKEYTTALLGQRGVEAQATAMGEMGIGTLFASLATTMALNGHLTGGGPLEPKAAKEWKAQGNLPYSVTWMGADGTRKFFQLDRFDPWQMPFTIIADIVQVQQIQQMSDDQEESLTTAFTTALANQIRNKTYLQGLASFMDMMMDEKKMETQLPRFIAGFTPFSSLGASTNPDPYMHEVNGLLDAVKSKFYPFSADVPVRYDALGDKVTVPGRFMSASKQAPPLMQALDERFANTGSYPQGPAPKVGTDRVDLRELTLEDGKTNAFSRYQELAGHPGKGPSLSKALEKVVQSKDYLAAPHGRASQPGTKEWIMERYITGYRRDGLIALQRESKVVRDAMSEKAIDVKNATAAGKATLQSAAGQGAATEINKLLTNSGLPAMSVPNKVAPPGPEMAPFSSGQQ